MSGQKASFPTGLSGTFKKTDEGLTDSLKKENNQLKQRLHDTIQENKKLRAQLHHLSRLLDKARHQGFTSSTYDVEAGIAIMKEIDEKSMLEGTKAPAAGSDEGVDEPAPHNRVDAKTSQDNRDKRRFLPRIEFNDHEGAVFCARFSPQGTLVASGSFDKSVRVYDVEGTKQRWKLEGHTMLVSTVSWAAGAESLVSASFDSSCRLWDITAGKCIAEFCPASRSGFMLWVTFNGSDNNTFFATRSDASVFWFDRRGPPRPQVDLQHECMVNTLHVLPGGQQLLLGDKQGCVTAWDTRLMSQAVSRVVPSDPVDTLDATPSKVRPASGQGLFPEGTPMQQMQKFRQVDVTLLSCNIQSAKWSASENSQISHLHTPVMGPEEFHGRYLAVNAYDNVIRLYDRGSFAGDVPSTTTPKLVHRILGHGFKNSGFPIHSCFWVGDQSSRGGSPEDELTFADSVLLATGSSGSNAVSSDSDHAAFVFDITDTIRNGGESPLLQRLTGHTDIVYGVHCHPKLPWMLTYSADTSIKIWAPRQGMGEW